MWVRLTQSICGRKDQELVVKVDRVGAHGAMQDLLAVTAGFSPPLLEGRVRILKLFTSALLLPMLPKSYSDQEAAAKDTQGWIKIGSLLTFTYK